MAERQAREAEIKAKLDIKAAFFELEASLQMSREDSFKRVDSFFKEKQLVSNQRSSVILSRVDERLSSDVTGLESLANDNKDAAIRLIVQKVCSLNVGKV